MKTSTRIDMPATSPDLPPPPPQIPDVINDHGWLGRLVTHGLDREPDEQPEELPEGPPLPAPPLQLPDVERRGVDPTRIERG